MGITGDFTKRVTVVNYKFCNDLIFFFKEFLNLKVYYLDPLMLNTNLLINCYYDKDIYDFNMIYKASFYSINQCLQKQEECEHIC